MEIFIIRVSGSGDYLQRKESLHVGNIIQNIVADPGSGAETMTGELQYLGFPPDSSESQAIAHE